MDTMTESFEDLFRQEDTKKMRRLAPGQKITATIVGISGESVFLDVGGKSEGVMNSAEITDKDGALTKGIGDTVDVYFLKSRSAESLFTTRVGSGSNADHLEEAWRSGIPIEGFVKAEIKGGFEITMGGNIRAFCPFSQMSLRRVVDPALEFIGTHMIFRITRFEESGRNIVVSARAIQEEERERQKELMKTSLQEGQTVAGHGHLDPRFWCLYRYWRHRCPHPHLGDRLEPGGKYRRTSQCRPGGQGRYQEPRLGKGTGSPVSLRETLADPWESVQVQFPEGSTHPGKVARLTQFGAFVTLAPGIDGLVHISKLGGGRRIHHPREVLEVDQNIDVKIESIDATARKISLAPADYVSPEVQEDVEKTEYRKYIEKSKSSSPAQATGSLGELLKARMAEKKTR